MVAKMASATTLITSLLLASLAGITGGCTAKSASETVYQSRFSKILSEWSPQAISQSPNERRTFLGGFVEEPVSLTLSDLPPHDFVRIHFDLLILMTWDGSGRHSGPGPDPVGPDFFHVWVEDGSPLMMQTFSNIPREPGFNEETTYQSYPSPVPGDLLPSQTGASERQTLGYDYRAGPGFIMDSVYRITLLFPHRGSKLQLNFAAPGLQRIMAPRGRQDELWGLDKVTVEALPAAAVKQPTAADARALLETAAEKGDPIAAHQAFQRLLGGGAETRAVLRAARDDAGVNWEELDRWVSQLGSDDEATRTKAREQLLAQGAIIEMPLRVATLSTDSDSFRDEARDVMGEVLMQPLTDLRKRRAAVANRVLHVIGDNP